MQAVDVEDPAAGHVQFAPRRDGVEDVGAEFEVGVPAPATARPLFSLSTPGWLRVSVVAVTIATLLFGALGVRAAVQRSDTADNVALRSTPLHIDAQELYLALADADAAASTAFLQAGEEPAALRARYRDDIDQAAAALTSLGSNPAATPAMLGSLAVISRGLSEYTGLVESARANNRLGHSVGAAYLRNASGLMRETVLPAATEIFTDAAIDLDDRQRSGTSPAARTAVIVSAALLLVVLVAIQLFVTRRTRRLVNIGLALATVIVVGTAVVAHVTLSQQERWLTRPRDEGSDQLLVLSEARILALRSLSDENLHLIERGSTLEYRDNFDVVTQSIGSTSEHTGLLGAAVDLADGESEELRIRTIGAMMDEYLAGHDFVRGLDDDRDHAAAVTAAVTQLAQAEAELDAALAAETDEARADLERFAGESRQAVRWLALAVLLTAVLAWALAAFGIEIRLREYR